MKKPTAIIQARMGSTRLPGKMMKLLDGKPIINHVLDGASTIQGVENVIVATTDQPGDDAFAEYLAGIGVKVHRGPSDDVLARLYVAAKNAGADPVIRICGDNVFLAAKPAASMIREHIRFDADYTYCSSPIPLGTAPEVVSFRGLETAFHKAKEPAFREHVTPYLKENPKEFRIHSVEAPEEFHAGFRLTMDEEADYRMMEKLFERLRLDGREPDLENAIGTLKKHSEIAGINSLIKQRNWRDGY